ncbi:hypothetical protein EN35_31860 [Rhodococcus qingshengii]|nr:hypothetical protein EN35_31860 [Rhodococcus qingshengii]
MVAGLLIPAYPTQRHKVEAARELFRDFWQSPSAASGRAVSRGLAKGTAVNERIHEYLRVPTALIVVPIFALANAGVDLRGGLLIEAFSARVTWGVVLGLVLASSSASEQPHTSLSDSERADYRRGSAWAV